MPWNKDGGGGGGWQGGGGNNRGPWGQGPSGPGGNRGSAPPDLEELIRRIQAGLRGMIPSGGRSAWILPLVVVLLFIGFKSIYQVQADERGLVLRFGAYTRFAEPGLHFAFWPVETMEKIRFAAQRQTEIGGNDEGLMLAGDQNIVSVRFTVFWRIQDGREYQFNVKDQENVIRAVAESAMREIIGRTPAEQFRTIGRKAAEDQVFTITQETLDAYKSGVLLTGIRLNEADPPPEVRDAFAEVQRAEQDQAKSVNEADQYANQKLRRAEGEAAKIVQDAIGYKAQAVAGAQGESQRFLKVLEEYSKAKDVTRERLFLETLEDILSKSNKVVIEGDANGVVPYLPLPDIQKKTEPPPSAETSGQGVAQQ